MSKIWVLVNLQIASLTGFWRADICILANIEGQKLNFWQIQVYQNCQTLYFWHLWRAKIAILGNFVVPISCLVKIESQNLSKFDFEKGLLQMQTHSVEIWWFFYYSDFTWNQFWGLWKCKICYFITFRGSEVWFFMNFCTFEINKIQGCKKSQKTAFLEL